MIGMRCTRCGETRWSLLTAPSLQRSTTCPLCQGELVPERRQPGKASRLPDDERRGRVVRPVAVGDEASLV